MPKTRWPKISYTLTHQTPLCHPIIGQMRVSDEVSKTGGHLIEDLEEGRRRRRHHHGTRSLPAETAAFCHCVLLLLLLLLPLHQPAQNRRTVGDAHLDQCMNGARIFIIGSCYQSLSSSYAYLFNSPPLIIRSGVLMNEWIIAISVKLVVVAAAAAAVQPAHEWWREQTSYWRAIRCLLIPNPSWFLLFLVFFGFFFSGSVNLLDVSVISWIGLLDVLLVRNDVFQSSTYSLCAVSGCHLPFATNLIDISPHPWSLIIVSCCWILFINKFDDVMCVFQRNTSTPSFETLTVPAGIFGCVCFWRCKLSLFLEGVWMPQLPVANVLVMNEARVTASVSRYVQSSILAVNVLS